MRLGLLCRHARAPGRLRRLATPHTSARLSLGPPPPAVSAAEYKHPDTTFAPYLFRQLELSTFSDAELRQVFERYDLDASGDLDPDEIARILLHEKASGQRPQDIAANVERTTAHLIGSSGRLTYEVFREKIKTLAEQRDERIWPIACTMLVAGIAVGVVLPVMPVLVNEIGLSHAQYGYVVSSFGLAKLLGNLPAAMLVDRHGRRAMMSAGLVVIGIGTAGLGLAHSLEELLVARLMSGVGVSVMIAGASMAVADISTPLNRARMMAPMMAAFNAGTMLGPAMGGALAGSIGIASTFFLVGGLFWVNAAATQLLTSETMLPPVSGTSTPPKSFMSAMKQTFSQWRPLLSHPELRPLLLLNGAYWVSLSGANMTILPLILASERFGMSPAEVGLCFAMQSVITVMGAPFSASVADRVGPSRMIAPALITSASAMMVFPCAETQPQALAVLCLWAIGGTILGSTPTAHAMNQVSPADRAATLALMRTMGDLGLFTGATAIGITATSLGSDQALQLTSVFLATTAIAYLSRSRLQSLLK